MSSTSLIAATRHRSPSGATAVQGTFDELGPTLAETTFVVVDLETTGGSPATSAITEIGAVKVRGGVELGEFQTLVNPASRIPAFISVLTGITDAMVADAPSIREVLPAFLEFAGDAVLVAHNARFDVGFLRSAAERQGLPWHEPVVLDTVHLARQLVSRDEVPNHKLGTLAALFSTRTTPDHRALHDARATVDVLHALIGRVGNQGVTTLAELRTFTSRVTPAQRRKRHLADGLPTGPGVYVFRDGHGRALYVGTSHDIRSRVRTYFTASERRSRMAEMVGLAESVTPIVCATRLEAQVRELRLIAQHQPRYNRRSRHPDKVVWVKLTDEPFPRLSLVREVRDDAATYCGPFTSRAAAEDAVAAIHEALPLRRCTTRLGLRPRGTACALAELGRCGAPCTGQQSRDDYAVVVAAARAVLRDDSRHVVGRLEERMARLSADERFEEAVTVRDRLMALVRGARRAQRLDPLAGTREVVAARRVVTGGWEVVCVRHGRLAGTTTTPPGADPMPHIAALRQSAEDVPAPPPGRRAASAEEMELVLRWLEGDDVRLVELDGRWNCPTGGAEGAHARLEPKATAARDFHADAPWPRVPGLPTRTRLGA
ncbi:DEDD exonuclease domain-containing protein [Arsenicicoccus sp. oral taxon 190]|uniref:DEDD exonuclease domain-containing protein n=1 Tax=Arsenicicoccus sp. oral taxon 190 TaxID=1658671 RepID=UPI00067A0A6E|nr:DEDD exonuclease domain-containing protein [Arsenicicoccus sp. oral taxon 190]AKT52051.1 endonuclease [Arsenicicoccus sp. oral taxon 190]